MALINYRRFEPSTVILDDSRDPWVSWAHHLARTGRGGVHPTRPASRPGRRQIRNRVRLMQIIHCARGRITTRFAEDIGRGFPHRGIDLGHGDATVDDLRIVAPAAGRVVAAGRDGSYGNRVIIDHGAGWTSLIAHLSSYNVRVGQDVEQGKSIAVMGNTGTVYVHAHQELRLNGVWVDPELHLSTTTTAADKVSALDEEATMYGPQIIHHVRGADQAYYEYDTLLGVYPKPDSVSFEVWKRSTDQDDPGAIKTYSNEELDMLQQLAANRRARAAALGVAA